MEVTEELYLELRREATEAKEKAQRARGALDTLMKRLKDEWDCTTLPEAEKRLAEMERAADKARKELDTARSEYYRKWKKDGDA